VEILIITGACGVGKTTTAIEWAKSKNGALVECDYFTEWIHNSDFPHWTVEEEKFVASLAVTVAKEYLRSRMSIAIENVWSPIGIKILIEKLLEIDFVHSIKVIWLYCDLEENHRRDEMRIPENQMKERVDVVNKELREYIWPKYVQKLNSTGKSARQIIALIENLDQIDFSEIE